MHRLRFWLLAASLPWACGCGSGGCSSPHGYPTVREYRSAELRDRAEKARPALDALEQYRAARGRYPDTLDDLVGAGLLGAVPDITGKADHQGKGGRIHRAEPLGYQVSHDRSDFTLAVRVYFSELGFMDSGAAFLHYHRDAGEWKAVSPRFTRPGRPGNRVPPTRKE